MTAPTSAPTAPPPAPVRLVPGPPAALDLAGLAEHYAHPAGGGGPDGAGPWVRTNFVSSLDGAAAVSGTSRGLQTPLDTYVYGLLRALSDVVLMGAGTARDEQVGPARVRAAFAHLREGRPAAPRLAVVTRSAAIDPGSSFVADAPADRPTLVLTCRQAPAERRQALADAGAEVVVVGDETVDLGVAAAALAERGLGRVLCEGGPRLAADLLAEGLVDEWALTLSPTLAGGDAVRPLSGAAPPGGLVRVTTAGLVLDPADGTLAGRWPVLRSSAPSR